MNKQYNLLTQKVIKSLKKNKLPWRSPYVDFSIPLRFTGEQYQGINTVTLSIAMNDKGYNFNTWMTYKQASKLGATVKKGEKSTSVYFFKPLEINDKEDEEKKIKIPLMRSYNVFNIEQIKGLDEKYYKKYDNEIMAKPDEFFKKVKINIINKHCTPAFWHRDDVIKMPFIDSFLSSEDYYSTLCHESIHWTGHWDRLGRFKKGEIRTEKERAFEELIAELGSIFLSSYLGVKSKLDENHVSYIGSWLRALENDNKFLLRASSQAQKAVDYLIDLHNIKNNEQIAA